MSGDPENTASQLNVLSHNPLVAGADLAELEQELTPTGKFFVRNHFPMPKLELDSWRHLHHEIGGCPHLRNPLNKRRIVTMRHGNVDLTTNLLLAFQEKMSGGI